MHALAAVTYQNMDITKLFINTINVFLTIFPVANIDLG
jgi:hypothetical protein